MSADPKLGRIIAKLSNVEFTARRTAEKLVEWESVDDYRNAEWLLDRVKEIDADFGFVRRYAELMAEYHGVEDE